MKRSGFLALTILLVTATSSAAQQSREVRVGVLGATMRMVDAVWVSEIFLVDLTKRAPRVITLSDFSTDDGAPYLFVIDCKNCPLLTGHTYKARISGSNTNDLAMQSITVHGKELSASSGDIKKYDGPAVAMRPPVQSCGSTTDAKGYRHWTFRYGSAACVTGPDPLDGLWLALDLDLESCMQQGPFRNTTLNILITMRPDSNQRWTAEDAPYKFASRFLSYLNNNDRGIVFKEASGVPATYSFTITLSRSANEGTSQGRASAIVTAAAKDVPALEATSGEFAFTTVEEALEQLSKNILKEFISGWHRVRPCVRADATILSASDAP